jgi:phospholipase C
MKILFILNALFLSTLLSQGAFAQSPKIVYVVLENTSYDEALAQPFLTQLAKEGTLLTNFHGVSHPSEPNYIAMVGGSTLGVHGDGHFDLGQKNIVDLLEAKNKSWKVYAEDYPGNCFLGMSSGKYVRKHNPLISFTNIQNNPSRCKNIVDSSSFVSDFTSSKISDYNMFIPNLDNDGHDTGASFADQWLSTTFSPLISNAQAMQNVILIVTFDEDDGFGGNKVFTVMYGLNINAGKQIADNFSHINLLRTIEDLFQLGNLGQEDALALPVKGFLKN